MSQPSQHGRFIWHELMTRDVAAAARFYEQVIGWTAEKSPMAGVDYTLFKDGDKRRAGLMPMTPDAAAMNVPPNWLGYVEVDRVDDTVALVNSLGGGVIVPAQDIPGVGRFAVLRDPTGAVFAVITSAMAPGEEGDPQPLDFSWCEVMTSDLQGAIAFYERVFGWKKQSEFDMGTHGIYHMFGRDRFTYGGMMTKPPEAKMPDCWTYYVRVRDTADAATDRAKALGATPMVGPMEVPGGDRVAVMADPQGAVFAVHSKA